MRSSGTNRQRSLFLTLLIPVVAGLLIATPMLIRRHAPSHVARRTEATFSTLSPAPQTYGLIPLSFEANRGQAEEAINFLARGAGYTLLLQPTEAIFVLSSHQGGEPSPRRPQQRVNDGSTQVEREAGAPPHQTDASGTVSPAPPAVVLRMKLIGADTGATVEGADELAGKVNYLIGNDPAQWRVNVPTFGRVRYREVYPGIDVIYYGNQRQLEYDFVVAPGRDARAVSLQFDGANAVEVDGSGDLLLGVGEEVIRQPKPLMYQEVAGGRRAVEGGYVVGKDGCVGFAVGTYDMERPLVIDPVLVYSTYLGGNGVDDSFAIAVDSSGSAYVTGVTTSSNFPLANPIQGTFGGPSGIFGGDAFVTKFDATGTALVYSTYLGGSNLDAGRDIAVDASGSAYVSGWTFSSNFPMANAFQAVNHGGSEVFAAKLNAEGTGFVYSTYLGGSGGDFNRGIAVDSSGNAYLSGNTDSDDFPTADPIQSPPRDGMFVTKLNVAGTALVYSTFFGGTRGGSDNYDIAVDSSGNAYVTGDTFAPDFPLVNPIQDTHHGSTDAFVTKINAEGTGFVYSTYLGGSGTDYGFAIAVDSSGNAYITGSTGSLDFPVANPFQGRFGGANVDAFVTKINADGSAFVYSTFLGGSTSEEGYGIAVDSSGNAYVTGFTASTDFPVVNPIQDTLRGGRPSTMSDAFVTRFNSAGTALVFSTYLGGTEDDLGYGIAVDSSGDFFYVTGRTASSNFPVANPFQGTFGGGPVHLGLGDSFVAKIHDPPPPVVQFSQASYSVNEDSTFVNLIVRRTGDPSTAVAVDYATSDGTASERSDYTTALGIIRFAAGQTEANVPVLIAEDSLAEGTEFFTVTLSNPTGRSLIGAQSTATIQIADDPVESPTNTNDETNFFVSQHYHDFLNRQPDAAGLAFWVNNIESCGANATCRQMRREDTSAAFFLSIEFQQTGFLVHKTFQAAFARPNVPLTFAEFIRDLNIVRQGLIGGQPGFEQQLEANKQAYFNEFVQRPEFVARYPESTPGGTYVDTLYANAGIVPTQAERDAAFSAFGNGGATGRARALRNVAESASVNARQFNPAFVLMQYFGYLRRNPNDAPDNNFAGYNFWLNKLNQFNGNFRAAEMVKAFITSSEYRSRFGQP